MTPGAWSIAFHAFLAGAAFHAVLVMWLATNKGCW
jgi:hypothetical protein